MKRNSMRTRTGRLSALVAIVASAALLGGGWAVAAPGDNGKAGENGKALGLAMAAVQNPDGSPKPGRDPARQRQVSLEDAAGQQTPEVPLGSKVPGNSGQAPGQIKQHDAKREKTDKLKRSAKVNPAEVMSDLAANGGCFREYGTPGQCLPAVPPSQAHHAGHGMSVKWRCDEVRTIFADGVVVRSEDVLGLDSNADGVACGAGDRSN